MAKISIIIPVYQVEAYINRCLDSLLAQTFSDYEVILVDDGSTDRSGEICEAYARRDSRFIVFHQKNQGQSVARNYALDWVFANSDSTHISFVDSDDWVHPKYLELLYQAVNHYGVNISQCLYLKTDGNAAAPEVGNQSLVVTASEQYINWYSAFFHTKLYVKSCLKHVRFPEGQIYEDTAIWYKVLFCETKIAIVKETLYYYFVNPTGSTHSHWKPNRLAQLKAWEDQIDYFHQCANVPVLNHALKIGCWTFKNQYEEIQDSAVISKTEKRKYKNQVKKRLRAILFRYSKELKQSGLYSRYLSFTNPCLGFVYRGCGFLKRRAGKLFRRS